jgi:hypothetical protein
MLNADPPRQGLMVAARLERLSETVRDSGQLAGAAVAASPARGTTRVWAATAGLNYWWSKRLRASVNYGIYSLSGSAATVTALPSARVQEVLLRLGFGL